MKKIILSALVLSMAVAVSAQDSKGRRHQGHEGKGKHHEKVMEKLDLTEDQKAKFKAENEAFRNKVAELKKNENITVKEFKSRMETIRKDHKTKIQGLLTTEQKAKIEKMKSEHQAKQKEHMQERGEKMSEKLGLTADQQAKMKANRENFGAKMKAIRENKSLDEAAKKEQMKSLMKEQKESMKSILTEEQIKKMEEMRKSHDGHRKQREGRGDAGKQNI